MKQTQCSDTSRSQDGLRIFHSQDSKPTEEQIKRWCQEMERYVNFNDESEHEATEQKEGDYQESRLPGDSWFASGTLSGGENTSGGPAALQPFPLLRRSPAVGRRRRTAAGSTAAKRVSGGTGRLSREEEDSLPSQEDTENIIRDILNIPRDVAIEDAWPVDVTPWVRYKEIDTLMLVLCCSESNGATVQEIINFLVKRYPVLANTRTSNSGWCGTLRGYLTHLPQFRRIERDGKKGDYWVLDVTKIHGHR
ncbi:hypothetical protein JR316_0001560 [Psilocybe cubensis]|uniref:Uncharacterized protein n=2 Tax=Psilocybe cubensis TaxID=181762 RepID=A0ACB8HB02_PSICU|nr:hypothetical protein JR316_0001560 [Psilocybe cubensis]KAH9484661.1 hypothetical protein JR316_0001560 [Psilocybe cubensis]